MSYESLKSAVSAVISANGNNEITGEILKNLINDNLIPQLGTGKYQGLAVPTTNPSTPETEVFYLARQKGVYANFNGVELDGREVKMLKWNGTTWVAENLQISSLINVNQKTSWPLSENAEFLTNTTYNFDTARRFVVDMYLEGTKVVGKQYSVTIISRNNSGVWKIQIYEETPVSSGTPSVFREVCRFITSADPENGDTITVHDLVEIGGSGISGKIAVRWSSLPVGTYDNLWASGSHLNRLDEEVFNKEKSTYIYPSERLTENNTQLISDIAGLYSLQEINDLFSTVTIYDSLSSEITPNFVNGNSRTSPFSGWGSMFDKVGVSFNALRLKNLRRGSVSEIQKWQYIRCFVKNVRTDAAPIAITPYVKIDRESSTINEVVLPLIDPTNAEFITLDDSSFAGSDYFIGYIFYNANKDVAYGGETLGTQSNFGGLSFYNTDTSHTSWSPYSGNPTVPFEHLLLVNPSSAFSLLEAQVLSGRITALENASNTTPRIILPDEFNAVVGYPQQLFFRGMIEDLNPIDGFNIKVTGNVGGRQYPRYYLFTPTSAGTYVFTISLYDKNNNLIASESCNVVVAAVGVSPSSTKRILCIGDSLTAGGVWPGELQRLLAQSGGSPTALNLNNIELIGTAGSGVNKYEGYGGKTWNWYINETVSGDLDVKFNTDVSLLPHDNSDLVSIWQDGDGDQWRLETVGTTGIYFSRVGHTSTPPSSGVLTHVSGANNTQDIPYTSFTGGTVNPFWNASTDQLDFTNYIGTNGFSNVDYVCVLLTWNGMAPNRAEISDHASLIADAKTFVDKLHQQYPNCKIKIMGIQLPSIDGGLAQNYGDGTSNYGNYFGLARTVFGLNLAYQDWANDPAYSPFLEFVNVSGQFDTLYNMPKSQRAVNLRNGADTEQAGTNGVHPASEGYLQIADAIFRNMNKEF